MKFVDDKVFNLLRNSQPDALKKITFMNGDVSIDNLKMCAADQQELCEEIEIVFHCAACLYFKLKILSV